MTYLALCTVFLAAAAVVAALAWRSRPRGHAAALALAAAVLVVLTAVFDTVMIGAGLFAYDDAHLAGVAVGLAPIEDFAYPIAVLLLMSALWNVIGARRPRGIRTPGRTDGRREARR